MPWCHFIRFENSVEPLMPRIVIVGNYGESPLPKLSDACWPCWKAFATCLLQLLAVKSGSLQAPELNQTGSQCRKGPQPAPDRQHKYQLYKHCWGLHVKTTLSQSKQERTNWTFSLFIKETLVPFRFEKRAKSVWAEINCLVLNVTFQPVKHGTETLKLPNAFVVERNSPADEVLSSCFLDFSGQTVI